MKVKRMNERMKEAKTTIEEQSSKHFREIRIISKNMITDFVQGIRNMLGLRLRSYEVALQREMDELAEKHLRNKEAKWYRYDIEQAGSGAYIITIYGEYI